MRAHDLDEFHQTRGSKSPTLMVVLLFLGMTLALAGNAYQFVRFEHMKRDVALMKKSTDRQIAKLTDAAAAELEENQQRFEAIKIQIEERAAGQRTSSLARHKIDRVSLFVSGGRQANQ